MLFSVQDYINDASQSTPEEKEFIKNCECRASSIYNGDGLDLVSFYVFYIKVT